MSEERTNCNDRLVGCFECDGHYDEVTETYETKIKVKKYSVPNVPILRCAKCGDEVISGEGSRTIESGLESQGFKFRKFHSPNDPDQTRR